MFGHYGTVLWFFGSGSGLVTLIQSLLGYHTQLHSQGRRRKQIGRHDPCNDSAYVILPTRVHDKGGAIPCGCEDNDVELPEKQPHHGDCHSQRQRLQTSHYGRSHDSPVNRAVNRIAQIGDNREVDIAQKTKHPLYCSSQRITTT